MGSRTKPLRPHQSRSECTRVNRFTGTTGRQVRGAFGKHKDAEYKKTRIKRRRSGVKIENAQ